MCVFIFSVDRIEPKEIGRYLVTARAREAVKLLGKYSDLKGDFTVPKKEFSLIKNHLVLMLLIDNAHRPGVVYNMTVEQYLQCQKNQDCEGVTLYQTVVSYSFF